MSQKLLWARVRQIVGNGFQFVLTTAVIFAVVFAVLNFSAYEKQLSFLLESHVATSANSALLKSDLITADALVTTPTSILEDAKSEDAGAAPTQLKTHRVVASTAPTLSTTDLTVAPPGSFIFIPHINVRAPIVEPVGVNYGGAWKAVEDQIQKSLEQGVVHLSGTALPGERGNVFLTGHSSYYPWAPGKYKDVFALLPRVEIGDAVEVYHDEQRFVYRVTDLREVLPTDVGVIAPTDDYRLTLMTCTPVGTALRRLIVTAHLESAPGAEIAAVR